jgi:phosphoribosylanthranilate isomerase
MPVRAKICGLKTPEAITAAAAGGAEFIGFVFYPPSPRAVTTPEARDLAGLVPVGIVKTGVFVDADDDTLAEAIDAAGLELLQLHGSESPERVAAIRENTGLPAMKAIKVAGAADLNAVTAYAGVADRLLFDAKPPKTKTDALPGGNALAFDWRLLAAVRCDTPWFLSGGLTVDNVAEAVAISGAGFVDVSSGVETAPGVKDPTLITRFLDTVATL